MCVSNVPGKMANSNKANMRVCDAHIRVANVIIHTETTRSLYRARLCRFFFASHDENNFNTFFAIQAHNVEPKQRLFSNQQSANEQMGLKHWHMKCVVNFYYISAAVIHTSDVDYLKRPDSRESAEWYKRIYLAQIIHNSRYRTLRLGERNGFSWKKRKKKITKNKLSVSGPKWKANHELESCLFMCFSFSFLWKSSKWNKFCKLKRTRVYGGKLKNKFKDLQLLLDCRPIASTRRSFLINFLLNMFALDLDEMTRMLILWKIFQFYSILHSKLRKL